MLRSGVLSSARLLVMACLGGAVMLLAVPGSSHGAPPEPAVIRPVPSNAPLRVIHGARIEVAPRRDHDVPVGQFRLIHGPQVATHPARDQPRKNQLLIVHGAQVQTQSTVATAPGAGQVLRLIHGPTVAEQVVPAR